MINFTEITLSSDDDNNRWYLHSTTYSRTHTNKQTNTNEWQTIWTIICIIGFWWYRLYMALHCIALQLWSKCSFIYWIYVRCFPLPFPLHSCFHWLSHWTVLRRSLGEFVRHDSRKETANRIMQIVYIA